MKKLLILLIAFCQLPIAHSQAPQSWTSAEMYQALRKLNVLGSVLYLAAHPDDENTRLIAYLSKDKLYRTGYLSMTRGDGGQNLIGDEQGIELGLIRTQELLAARRIDGGEQFFTRAYDFGYSKNPEETFTKWDKEKILSDVVWVIRKFQPDVIITRFPTTGEGGHGHHTASAILANEAFAAAADPNRFPEQFNQGDGLIPWQAKRLLWNTFNFGGNNTTREDQLKIDVGGYNPLLGKSYGEIAAESRSQHKSQGFGVPAQRGEALEYFKAIKGDQPTADLMEGIDLTWKRIQGGEVIEKIVDSIVATFDFLHPEKSVKGLITLYRSLPGIRKITDKERYWVSKKRGEILQLIEQCSGIFLDATTSEQYAVFTDSIKINFSFNNRAGTNIMLDHVSAFTGDLFDTVFNKSLEKNKNFAFSKTLYVSPRVNIISQPYWLEQKMSEGYYNVRRQVSIGEADGPSWINMTVNLSIDSVEFSISKPVRYKFTDPVRGELYEPLVVVPPVLLSPDEKIKISKGNNNFEGTINLISKKKSFQTNITDVGREEVDSVKVKFGQNNIVFDERNKTIPVSYSIQANKDNTYHFGVDADDGRKDVYHRGMREIKYDHIPYINYFTEATVINRKLDLKTYNKKIGYIVGAGDKVPEALEQMGYDVTLLSDKELSRNHLDQYDAIITGVRAYNTNDWMNNHYDKLMKYVNDGGNLIVQYNTSNQIGPVRAKISPYNFDISRTRVTDENADVSFLKPEHPVMNFPNKITQDDFKGWIQERSIYHAAAFDSTKFETIFSMNDPGEKPDAGSLIIAKYGKGYFTYTGLVFFRELPAGVPGAYRLMANLIALNKKKAF